MPNWPVYGRVIRMEPTEPTETALRKTFKYTLKPTPHQERELERVLDQCCRLYNVALDHRKTAYERCHVSITP
jgi:Helix-turn-helix domain